MKIQLPLETRQSNSRRNEQGMAVIVVIALIAILLIYVGGNLRTLHLLNRDLKQIEQQQLRRLNVPRPATNTVAVWNVSGFTTQISSVTAINVKGAGLPSVRK